MRGRTRGRRGLFPAGSGTSRSRTRLILIVLFDAAVAPTMRCSRRSFVLTTRAGGVGDHTQIGGDALYQYAFRESSAITYNIAHRPSRDPHAGARHLLRRVPVATRELQLAA